ncbi:hypothetical protein N6L24_12190 [Cognatishimia sp. SS12]|uniref:hypothetical protein n=1 Tax=Cognatishimia sp. SS12 TaxID=2979465 RepID=UPI00232C2800|nr:hypothetical protein [Cognatishimia sp. SS12]MDC0739040.1 hypothetical protein [Cognatishimia sp. SS12]
MHILIGLVLAFVLIAIFSNRKTRGCRWRADRRRNGAAGDFYMCVACGAEVFTTDGAPPKICLKDGPR